MRWLAKSQSKRGRVKGKRGEGCYALLEMIILDLMASMTIGVKSAREEATECHRLQTDYEPSSGRKQTRRERGKEGGWLLRFVGDDYPRLNGESYHRRQVDT